jgi:hypothetical protein
MKIANNGPHMFTLTDAVNLLNNSAGSQGLVPSRLQTNSALKGDYILTDEQALNEAERIRTGKHALDNPQGLGLGYLAGGKLPGHPTFSDESPYVIQGLKSAEGGQWSGNEGNWSYAPSQSQFDRNPEYKKQLMEYCQNEKGKGINRIVLPNGRRIE